MSKNNIDKDDMVGKRILIFNQELSGVNEIIFSLLRKRGWQLTIIKVPFPRILLLKTMISTFTPHISRWKENIIKKSSELDKLSSTFIKKTKFCEKKIRELDGKFDVIFQFLSQFAPTLNYETLEKPYVIFHDYTEVLCQKYPEWACIPSEMNKWIDLEKNLYHNAQFIFATSENTRNSFINDYGTQDKKVITVLYGSPLKIPIQNSKAYTNNVILFVGKEFKRKGGLILLEAFTHVKKEIKDAKLVIVGSNISENNFNQPGIQTLGYVQDPQIFKKLYESASLFVLPSFCEPFGLVFLEAMAYQLPCIGTTIDAIPEIIEDGKTGYLVSPGEAQMLAERIITLLKDPSLAEKMGRAGITRLQHQFRWENLGDQLDVCLKKCVERK